jgi:hypothetical protein
MSESRSNKEICLAINVTQISNVGFIYVFVHTYSIFDVRFSFNDTKQQRDFEQNKSTNTAT